MTNHSFIRYRSGVKWPDSQTSEVVQVLSGRGREAKGTANDLGRLGIRLSDKLVLQVARHVAGTDRVVCSGEFPGNLYLSNRILSPQNVAQIQSDLMLCDLLRRQNSIAETKIFRKVLHYRDLSLRFVAATCCCKYAFCMVASFYYCDQNPLRFSFHILIWYSQ